MKITIDHFAGFCPGVQNAIRKAEKLLDKGQHLHSYGSLLHNEIEMDRLKEKGLKLAEEVDFPELTSATLLIRAHGEPPGTYEKATNHGIGLVDATCGIVRRLQKKVEKAADEMQSLNGQVVIFGKAGHPEVVGLVGYSSGRAIVVSADDIVGIDFHRPVRMFSQTTMDDDKYEDVAAKVLSAMTAINPKPDFVKYDTICRHVTKRVPQLKKFAVASEVIIFVSGTESSNGKKLFEECRKVNPRSHFISDAGELKGEWFTDAATIGVSGAASTPMWLMKVVADKIKEMI